MCSVSPCVILPLLLSLSHTLAAKLGIDMLNKNGTLFDRSECHLLLYRMTPSDTQVVVVMFIGIIPPKVTSVTYFAKKTSWHVLLKKAVHLHSAYGTYSANNVDMKKPNPHGFPGFPCLIGMSYLDQVLKQIKT